MQPGRKELSHKSWTVFRRGIKGSFHLLPTSAHLRKEQKANESLSETQRRSSGRHALALGLAEQQRKGPLPSSLTPGKLQEILARVIM